jgi:inhibitor of cysteine peptidase
MRKESRLLLSALLTMATLALTATGCSPTPPATVTLGAQDDGRTITLKSGDTLIIELEGNPTTGFSWEVEAVDDAILALQGDAQYTASETGLVGSGGVFTFTFRAASKGQTPLQLVYHRSWENVAPEDTFEVTVVVD